MKSFVIVQMKIDKEQTSDNTKNISMSTIVRLVKAKDKETAIGKFVLETQQIQAIKKLEIECYDIDYLKTIE